MAVAPDRLEALLTALEGQGVAVRAVIGRIIETVDTRQADDAQMPGHIAVS